MLTIVDDSSKEAIDLAVDFGISGHYVTGVLDQAPRFRGYTKAIRTDQGPEFTGKALDQWAYQHGLQLKLIQAGKPTQNAFIESFNGRFRDECLYHHWLTSLPQASILITVWRRDYNQHRPHGSLYCLTPSDFVAKHRSSDPDDPVGKGCLYQCNAKIFTKTPLALNPGGTSKGLH